ncbi:MAG: hypothetical protein ACRES0_28120 [Pseudomonas sp.]
MSEDGVNRQMAETATQPVLEFQASEKLLDQHEPRKRGQLAVLEPQGGKAVGLAVYSGFAKLHESGLLRGCYEYRKHIIPRSVGRFFYTPDHSIRFFNPWQDLTGGELQKTPKNSLKP